jgi:hypothetical protein
MTIDVAKCKELAIDLERVVWKGSDIDKRDMAGRMPRCAGVCNRILMAD